jgi:tetratricopeptide (TPR) repeat protein
MAQRTLSRHDKSSSQSAARPWRFTGQSPVTICIGLALLTFIFYWPVAHNDFVNYDDGDYVSSNPHIQAGFTRSSLIWAFTTAHASNWHPLTWLSHMLDIQMFGLRPGPHHLVSLAIHMANVMLLFLVLRTLTQTHWRSAAVAAFFALHPLRVESVAWISERKDGLSALFFLVCVWAYSCYARARTSEVKNGERSLTLPGSVKPARVCFAVSLLSFALGLLSKPMVVTLPFVLLLLDFWPLGRFEFKEWRTRKVAHLVIEKVPFFLLALASSWITYQAQKHGGAVSVSISLGARVANAVVSYVRYIGKTLWPAKLSVLYPHPGHWPAWEVGSAALVLLAISAAVLVFYRRRPYLLTGWLWFLGMLVPVIGLIQVGIQSMADRYTYLPQIGLLVLVIWSAHEVFQKLGWNNQAAAILCSVLLFLCAVATNIQIRYWRSSETLFSHAVQVTKNNYLAYNNLGFYLSSQGRVGEAMENYRLSLEINPNYEDALNNLGYALAGQKRYAEAMPYYEAALRVRPDHVEVHNNLGNALAESGRLNEAIQHYLVALKGNPQHADAHNNLGIALAMQGKLDEAIKHFEEAIALKGANPSAHSNLGNAYAAQRRYDEAVREYRETLRLKPNEAQAFNNLGNVLAEQGKLPEAIEQYRQALRLNSDNPEAHFNLGIALRRQGKNTEAAAEYRAALRLKPDYLQAQRELSELSQSSSQKQP